MFIIYLFAAISLVTFLIYGIDKMLAKAGAWRIPEKLLLGFSLLGGGIGGALGMSLFRHKTRHWYFVVLNAVGIAIQVALVIMVLVYPK